MNTSQALGRVAVALLIHVSILVAGGTDAMAVDSTHSPDPRVAADATTEVLRVQLDAADPGFVMPPPPTAAEISAAAARLEQAKGHVRQRGSAGPSSCPPSDPCPPTHVAWNLAATQEAQVNSYYCGPAAVRGALRMVGLVVSQTALASEMGTSSDGGTAWYNGRYPVENAMDAHTASRGLHYDSVGVSYTATSTDKANFAFRLVADIDYGAPLIGDAFEVPNGPRLVGHPLGSTIYHWFAIRGYASSGGMTAYQDSVHGASSIGWSPGVPAYSSLASATITSIVGGRGYVW